MAKSKLRPSAANTDNNDDTAISSDRDFYNNRASFPLFFWANQTDLAGEVTGTDQFFASGTCTDSKGRVVVHSARHAQDHMAGILTGTIDAPFDRHAHMALAATPMNVTRQQRINVEEGQQAGGAEAEGVKLRGDRGQAVLEV